MQPMGKTGKEKAPFRKETGLFLQCVCLGLSKIILCYFHHRAFADVWLALFHLSTF